MAWQSLGATCEPIAMSACVFARKTLLHLCSAFLAFASLARTISQQSSATPDAHGMHHVRTLRRETTLDDTRVRQSSFGSSSSFQNAASFLQVHPTITSQGECSRFADLSQKLTAGKPVSMLAFGSSVAAGGGCTDAVEGVCSQTNCPNCCALGCNGNRGWVRDVFDAINRTWPHPKHALRNLAQSGGGLAVLMESCLRDFVSYPVDLFILEMAANGGSKSDLERLTQKLVGDQQQRYGHDPLVLFASFTPIMGDEFGEGRAQTISEIAAAMGYPAYESRPLRMLLNESTKARVLEDGWLHPKAAPVPELSDPMSEHVISKVHDCQHTVARSPRFPDNGEQWSCLRFTGDGTQFNSRKEDAVKDVARAIKVVNQTDWHTVSQVASSRSKYKPGLQSNVTNSFLRVQLLSDRESFKLRGTYLSSYQGFGSARLVCESCQCSPQVLSGSHAEHVSVDASFNTSISNAQNGCFVRFTVTEPAFKITSLAVTM